MAQLWNAQGHTEKQHTILEGALALGSAPGSILVGNGELTDLRALLAGHSWSSLSLDLQPRLLCCTAHTSHPHRPQSSHARIKFLLFHPQPTHLYLPIVVNGNSILPDHLDQKRESSSLIPLLCSLLSSLSTNFSALPAECTQKSATFHQAHWCDWSESLAASWLFALASCPLSLFLSLFSFLTTAAGVVLLKLASDQRRLAG